MLNRHNIKDEPDEVDQAIINLMGPVPVSAPPRMSAATDLPIVVKPADGAAADNQAKTKPKGKFRRLLTGWLKF